MRASGLLPRALCVPDLEAAVGGVEELGQVALEALEAASAPQQLLGYQLLTIAHMLVGVRERDRRSALGALVEVPEAHVPAFPCLGEVETAQGRQASKAMLLGTLASQGVRQ